MAQLSIAPFVEDRIEQHPASQGLENATLEIKRSKAYAESEESHTQEPESRQDNNPVHFPDGGTQAWIQVLVGHLLMFNTWGLVNTFGAFQAYYSSFDPPIASPSAISWIGSIQSWLLLSVSAICGRFFDLGYAKTMTVTGTVVSTLGLVLTSFSGEFGPTRHPVFWQLLLGQGVLTGLGLGCLMVPSVTIVSSYFNRRRGLAMGLTTLGSSIGGILYPILFRNILAKLGFHWAMRVLALVLFVTLALACVAMKQRMDILAPRTKNSHEKAGNRSEGLLKNVKELAWGDWPYLAYCVGMLWTCMGLYTPYFFIEAFTIQSGISLHGLQSVYLVSIMNAGGILGRIIPGMLADIIGPVNMQLTCVLISGLAIFGWINITTLPTLLIFTCVYGFFASATIALPPASISSLTTDYSVLGMRMGFMFSTTSFGVLAGPPIAGAISGHEGKRGRDMAMVYAGIMLVLGSGLMILARVLKVGFHWQGRT